MKSRIALLSILACAGLALVTVLCMRSIPLFAQTPVEPGPHIVAQQAGFIAVGTVQFNEGQCIFTATESLKGTGTVGVPVTLISPIAEFSVQWLQGNVADQSTIIVGTYDMVSGQVTLTSGKHSVWPQGTFPDYFADKTIAGCKDFIQKAHQQ